MFSFIHASGIIPYLYIAIYQCKFTSFLPYAFTQTKKKVTESRKADSHLYYIYSSEDYSSAGLRLV